MRVIVNDKRYGALKTLGERKQAFNEVLFLKHSTIGIVTGSQLALTKILPEMVRNEFCFYSLLEL